MAKYISACGTFLLALVLSGSAIANSKPLPGSMVWTAYASNTSGYAQAVAMGNMFQNRYGMRLSVIPGKNDVARMTPVRAGRASYCMCGATAYFATEGVGMFAKPDWGPQNYRLLLSALGDNGVGLAVRADSDIKTIKDLKGHRVPWVRGADSINVPMTGFLAFGDLDWSDVKKVEFSGFRGMWQALLNGQADAAFATTVTPMAKQLASSPDGIRWLPMPHDDKAAWQRLGAVVPYFIQKNATAGASISPEHPFEGAAYPYPVLIGQASNSADQVYTLVKALVEHYGDYKDGAPGAEGWALKNQNFDWVIPYHEGAVRYFREAGVWTKKDQEHNQHLIKRQNVINQAWKVFKGGDVPSDDGKAKAAWMQLRAKALTDAGFDPIFH